MRYYFTPVRIAIFKRTKKVTSVGEDIEKGEHLCTAGGIVDWFSHCGKQYGGS